MSSWVRICISTLPPFFGQTFWSTFLIWNTSNSEKRSAKQKTRLVEVSDERWVVFKTLKKKSCKNWPSKWTLCISSVQFSSVQSLSRVRLFATPWISARQASLSITNSQSSLRLTSIESLMPSSHLISSSPQSLPASESFPMSQIFAWGGQSTEFQL